MESKAGMGRDGWSPRSRRRGEAEGLLVAAVFADASLRRQIEDELDRRVVRGIVASMMRAAMAPSAA